MNIRMKIKELENTMDRINKELGFKEKDWTFASLWLFETKRDLGDLLISESFIEYQKWRANSSLSLDEAKLKLDSYSAKTLEEFIKEIDSSDEEFVNELQKGTEKKSDKQKEI